MSATTFEELWTELKADAAAEIATLKADAVAFEAKIVPTIEADIVLALGQFKQLAVATVLSFASAEFDAMTGKEKQSEVVTTVFQAAEAKGVQVAYSDVQMLGQQAYTAVATSLGAAVAAPPAS